MLKESSYMNMHFEEDSIQRYSEVDLFSTQGRIGRKRYFLFSIILPFVLFWSFASIAGVLTHLGSVAALIAYLFLGLATIAMFLILVHLTIQRCHDFNKSGWFSLFVVIPFANLIFAIIPGNNGLNQYGEVPEQASGFIKIAFYGLVTLLIASLSIATSHYLKANLSDWFVL